MADLSQGDKAGLGGNVKKVTEKITRNYIFTQKELKEKLGMKGNIEHVDLWSGAYQYEATKETETKDKNEWEIVTTEQAIEQQSTKNEPTKKS